MDEAKLVIKSPDLASRSSAAIERHKLLQHIAQGNAVVVDLSDVITISDSYADELFGVLVAVHGLDWFVKNISLINVSEHVLKSIAIVVKRRLEETKQPINLSA